MDALAKHAHRRLETTPHRGPRGLALLALRSIAWSLVYLELLLQTQLCACLVAATPLMLLLLPSTEWVRAWRRLRFCARGVLSPRLMLKTIFVGRGVTMHDRFELELARNSYAYRLLFYLL